MCGIVGYIGDREVIPILMQGLKRLEYRGYDSAGIACYDNGANALRVYKEKGKLSCLKGLLNGHPVDSGLGIGHTRWATHGSPSRANAHPHVDSKNRIVLVHNGIIENYASLKSELIRHGYTFRSETDTEVAVNLISHYYKKGKLVDAVRQAIKRMQGFFAFVIMAKEEPDKLIVFKRSNPLIIGLGEDENYVASDVSALLPYTRKVLYLDDDEYAVITQKQVNIYALISNHSVNRKPVTVRWDVAQAQKGGYSHFMLKEIHEQSQIVRGILDATLKRNRISFEGMSAAFEKRLKKIERIHLVSCGTAYHAGLVGNYLLGEWARLPVEATVSSEFRYEDPVVGEKDLVIVITQSGETADTLAALREAKKKKAMTLAIVNVVGSTIAREAECVLYTQAGPEIGVASTKAYLAQLVVLTLFSIYFGRLRNLKGNKELVRKIPAFFKELKHLPSQISQILHQSKVVKKAARQLYRHRNFIYLGRGYNFPTALEGALKLKEITYAHAHGYAAGEMKHGPIALIDSNQPVICICPKTSKTYEKMISNIEEIRARKGIIVTIANTGDKEISKLSNYTFFIPSASEMLTPILSVVPLQLLAYEVAVLNGRDVDQPRNLAKSVTVE